MREDILLAKGRSDEEWGQVALRREPLFEKMTQEEKRDCIRKALECAGEQYERLVTEHGRKAPSEYAALFGVGIEEDRSPAAAPFLYFATYTAQPPTIHLAVNAFKLVDQTLAAEPALAASFSGVPLREVAVAHELFHRLEELDEQMYVCQKNVRVSSLFGLVRYATASRALEEIAARHFSRLAVGLDYCPTVLEYILIYGDKTRNAGKGKNNFFFPGRTR